MSIKIDYKGNDFKQIRKLIFLAYKEVEHFFIKKPKHLIIKIHKTRKSFEEKLGRKTFDWEVANASYSGDIDILHPASFVKESTHSKKDFLPILKHEISHIFLDLLSNSNKIPKWLDEGFASFVAGLKISKDPVYIEDNFCKKLGTPNGWNKYVDQGAYKISQQFVGFLIKKYSAEKVTKLISSLEKNYYYDNFNQKFKMVFGKNLENIENDFVKALNSGFARKN